VVDGGNGEVRPGLGVNGVAWAVRDLVAFVSNLWDRYVVDGLVNLTALVLDNGSYLLRGVQNGLVQHYALAAFIGVFLLIASGHWFLGLY
jgi:NADH:ubiquinone oxidoreductase subunit 5 (subunit L)/multisubunit Na+/H+ antiporter MnhA subunit